MTPSDDFDLDNNNPALGGDYTRAFRLAITEIEPPTHSDLTRDANVALGECVLPGTPYSAGAARARGPAKPFEGTICVTGCGLAVLHRLIVAIDATRNQYPATVGGLQTAMIQALVGAGVPGAELHTEVDLAEEAYYNQLKRNLPQYLPRNLVWVYGFLRYHAGSPTLRHLRVYPDGSRWGHHGPTIVVGRLPHSYEYPVSLAPDDQDFLVVGKWVHRVVGEPVIEYKDVRLSLAESDKEDTRWRLYRLLGGDPAWNDEDPKCDSDEEWRDPNTEPEDWEVIE